MSKKETSHTFFPNRSFGIVLGSLAWLIVAVGMIARPTLVVAKTCESFFQPTTEFRQVTYSAVERTLRSVLVIPSAQSYLRLSGSYSGKEIIMTNKETSSVIEVSNLIREIDHRSGLNEHEHTAAERRDAMIAHDAYLIDRTVHPISEIHLHEDVIAAGIVRALSNEREIDILMSTYNSIRLEHAGRGTISKMDIDAVIENPVAFSIVYSQILGLSARVGADGQRLMSRVPWTGFVDMKQFAAYAAIARIAGALTIVPAHRLAADNLVLETLRARFAPEVPAGIKATQF